MEVKKHEIIKMKVQRRETRFRQKSNIDKMIDVPKRLHRQVPVVQDVQKTVEVHQAAVHHQSCRHLCEHAEENADGAGSARTAQR